MKKKLYATISVFQIITFLILSQWKILADGGKEYMTLHSPFLDYMNSWLITTTWIKLCLAVLLLLMQVTEREAVIRKIIFFQET